MYITQAFYLLCLLPMVVMTLIEFVCGPSPTSVLHETSIMYRVNGARSVIVAEHDNVLISQFEVETDSRVLL